MNLIDKLKSFVKLDFQKVSTNILIFYRIQNWTNIYYTLHSSILNRILDIDIDLNKMMPQAIKSYYVSMEKKKKKRITFIRCFVSYSNEIESNRRKQNCTYCTNRIVLNIIVRTRVITELNIQYCME